MARHVHYGALALKRHFAEISEKERQEREDWAFEVALLMKNRFLAHEMYEEWFEHKLSRCKWNVIIRQSEFMSNFSKLMFKAPDSQLRLRRPPCRAGRCVSPD